MVAKKVKTLIHGLSASGRGARLHKSGAWAVKNRRQDKKAEEKVAEKKQPARRYPADDIPKPLPSNKNKHRPTRLRSSITPGTVLILLAGRFRGHRVVFLKQLPSGLLLVTGPFRMNGIPLKRVNQAYVIATSTKIDVSAVVIPDGVNDSLFVAPADAHEKSAANFDKQKESKAPKKELPAEFKQFQKDVDAPIMAAIAKNSLLKKYMAATFSLSSHDRPHAMKF